jgi:D-xylose transport system permease protein
VRALHAPRLAETRWGPPVSLLALWLVLGLLHPRFLSAVNLTNLMLQIVAIGAITVGVVLVLLIGEIDLSVGAVSGLGAAVTAVLSVKHGWPALAAIMGGLAAGALIGLIHGRLVTRLGLPSFVVTLAGLLAWQGVLLMVLGDTGTVHLTDPVLVAIAGTFLSPAVGWVLAAGTAVAAAGAAAAAARRGGLPGTALPWLLATGVVAAAVAVFNADRGIPLAVVIFVLLLVVFDAVIRRTRLGRHAVAIGSNPQAARRAGIPVDRIRVVIFVLASLLSVSGGLLAASRLLAVNQSSGNTDLMLFAIAAAVIGGTSLFGGRGSVWSALLGSLVVGSITNGLDLLGVPPAVRSITIGAVLAVAVAVDARARTSQGGGVRELVRVRAGA